MQGVLICKMEELTRSLGSTNISLSQVSEMTKGLNKQMGDFSNRSLSQNCYSILLDYSNFVAFCKKSIIIILFANLIKGVVITVDKKSWMCGSHNMVDIIHGVIPYNGLEAKILENAIFSRLHRIFQSSLAYLTFPSNKVHRYEHSLGVMHLSGLFFFHSVCNSTPNEISLLLDEIERELYYWLDKGDADRYLSNTVLTDIQYEKAQYLRPQEPGKITYPECDLYRRFTPGNLNFKDRFLYYTVYEALRIVGLLHDIGHLPYSHITEFALQRLYQDAVQSNEQNHELEEFLEIMKPFGSHSGCKAQIHEMIGQKLVVKIFTSIKEEFGKSNGTNLLFMAAVFYISEQILKSTPGADTIYSDLHRIVDGVIDCDRMDYCCRDLYCAGVSKEVPQYERIFSSVQIYYGNPPRSVEYSTTNEHQIRKHCYFAFTSKALGQIDALLQRRWDDFSSINYHHRVHKHEMLLELAIYQLGREALGLGSVNHVNDTQETNKGLLPYDITGIWKTINAVQRPGAVDILISQLDDEWLNGLLKHKFFETYGNSYNDRIKHHNEPGWNRLDELITGQKHYQPLFKRTGGFRRFDKDFRKHYDGSTPSENDTQYFFDIKLRELTKSNPVNGTAEQYYLAVNRELINWLETDEAKGMSILDCFIAENNFSVGIGGKDMESIYIVSSQIGNDPEPLKGRSNISNSLERQKELFPSFHIYYLSFYDVTQDAYHEIDIPKLREAIARIMANCMKQILE